MNELFRVGGSKFFMWVLTVNRAKNGFTKISLFFRSGVVEFIKFRKMFQF